MSVVERILEAVTPRRVAAALLIGGFARALVAVLGWSASVGWDLARNPNLRALSGSGVDFALEVALIYLALRGLGAELRRVRVRGSGSAFAEDREGDGPARTIDEAAARPREEGRDGRDAEDL
ncbi:MAG TPA: hypothetical protein VHA80_12875 [Solirubrobacterales bacterium]|nr:hypothetical protein [Solirubrobacterales bacterium]